MQLFVFGRRDDQQSGGRRRRIGQGVDQFEQRLGLDDLAKFDKSGEQKTDLKEQVFNKYDYRVKFELTGPGAGLDGLKFVNNVQLSQAALPIITEGDNKLTFSAATRAEGTVTVRGEYGRSDDRVQDDRQAAIDRRFPSQLQG